MRLDLLRRHAWIRRYYTPDRFHVATPSTPHIRTFNFAQDSLNCVSTSLAAFAEEMNHVRRMIQTNNGTGKNNLME